MAALAWCRSSGPRLLDADGQDLTHGGGSLADLARLDLDPLHQALGSVTRGLATTRAVPGTGRRAAGSPRTRRRTRTAPPRSCSTLSEPPKTMSQRPDSGPKSWPRRCTKVTTAPMSTSSARPMRIAFRLRTRPKRWSGCGGSSQLRRGEPFCQQRQHQASVNDVRLRKVIVLHL
jgi:hypothetical protein